MLYNECFEFLCVFLGVVLATLLTREKGSVVAMSRGSAGAHDRGGGLDRVKGRRRCGASWWGSGVRGSVRAKKRCPEGCREWETERLKEFYVPEGTVTTFAESNGWYESEPAKDLQDADGGAQLSVSTRTWRRR